MEGGLPTGYMEENAFLGFQGRIPMPSAEDFLTAYGRAQELYASYGITTVQEGLMASQLVPLYQMLLKSGLLKLDLISFMDIRDSDAARTAFESHIKNYKGHMKIGGYKMFLDGSPQGRTAWMRTPYLPETPDMEEKAQADAFPRTRASKEDYCGYINSNTMRAGYPESKRTGETLCQAYIKEYGLDSVILRLARCYGPGILQNDSKALSQFIHRAKEKRDIILKSEGKQEFSYVYQADVVDAMCYFLQFGISGECYNVTGKDSDVSLKDLAEKIADMSGVLVKYELPDKNEAAGYSMATKAVLDGRKAETIGWTAVYPIWEGIKRSL